MQPHLLEPLTNFSSLWRIALFGTLTSFAFETNNPTFFMMLNGILGLTMLWPQFAKTVLNDEKNLSLIPTIKFLFFIHSCYIAYGILVSEPWMWVINIISVVLDFTILIELIGKESATKFQTKVFYTCHLPLLGIIFLAKNILEGDITWIYESLYGITTFITCIAFWPQAIQIIKHKWEKPNQTATNGIAAETSMGEILLMISTSLWAGMKIFILGETQGYWTPLTTPFIIIIPNLFILYFILKEIQTAKILIPQHKKAP